MDRKIALKWARALESGEYKQITGGLRGVTGFCCLGVLCNLHAQEHPAIAAQQLDIDEYMGGGGALPDEVMYWAGMESPDGKFIDLFRLKFGEDDEARNLIELNDEYGFNFKQIAKVLRKHSDKL